MTQKTIGIVITRIGGVDGVALETEKWIEVLENLGHSIQVLTGDLEREMPDTTVLPELYLYHAKNEAEQDLAFFHSENTDENQIQATVEENAGYLETHITQWLRDKKIDVLISQNCSALPCHLSLGLAIKRVIEKTGIESILHHHDFSWERSSRYQTSSQFVKDVIEEAFPPKDPNLKHVVINDFNKNNLKERFGIDATYVPNVMNFDQAYAEKDEYNADFREVVGLKPDDIVLAQVTRLVKRKGVETALELVSRLNDKRIKLMITGNILDETDPSYFPKLESLIKEYGIEDQVLFISDHVNDFRKDGPKEDKVYSLSDVYAHADACTYFSTYEGFGNAFVETMLAKKPIFVNNYKPVYWPNIGSLGFKNVMLEDNDLTEEKLQKIKEILFDQERQREMNEFNFELAKKYLSYPVLKTKLQSLL